MSDLLSLAGGFMIRMLTFGTRLLPRSVNARIGERIGSQYFLSDKKVGDRVS